MRIVIPFVPVYNHRLGVAYLVAALRGRGHEVLYVDLEHLLRCAEPGLALDMQDSIEVYAEKWADEIQYLHGTELLFEGLHPGDAACRGRLSPKEAGIVAALAGPVRSWAEALSGLGPDLFLIPALVSNLWLVLWLCDSLERECPGVPRVLGGRGLTYAETQELALAAGWADAVLAGEADLSIGSLADGLAAGLPIEKVDLPGLVRLQGGVLRAYPAPQRADPDRLPYPDFDGLPFPGATLRYYLETGRDFHDAVSLAGSRWCPNRCAYCYESIDPSNYRLRKVDLVLEEIAAQRSRFGTPRLFFCDSTLNVSSRWLSELALGMERLAPASRVTFAHFEPRRPGVALYELLARAGFDKVNFGLESLDEETLRRMDRSASPAEIEGTMLAAVKSGISIGANLVVNFPGESNEAFDRSLARTRVLAAKLAREASARGASVTFMVSQARIDPHSALFHHLERFGVRLVRRERAVPAALARLSPLFDRIALAWEDGTPPAERARRFAMARPFVEALSTPPRRLPPPDPEDRRVALDPGRVPAALAGLVRAAEASRLAAAREPVRVGEDAAC